MIQPLSKNDIRKIRVRLTFLTLCKHFWDDFSYMGLYHDQISLKALIARSLHQARAYITCLSELRLSNLLPEKSRKSLVKKIFYTIVDQLPELGNIVGKYDEWACSNSDFRRIFERKFLRTASSHFRLHPIERRLVCSRWPERTNRVSRWTDTPLLEILCFKTKM